MKKKRIILYAIVLVFLIGWLGLSNFFFIMKSGAEVVSHVRFDNGWRNKKVFFSVGEIYSQNDWAETIVVKGWAFVETEGDNEDRYVSLILKNEKDCYEMKCKPPEDQSTYDFEIVRKDVPQAYPDKKIPSPAVGFLCDFSTINVKNGIYKIYLLCHENGADYGISTTDIWIEKDGSNIKLYDWKSERIGKKTKTQPDLCRSSMEAYEVDGNVAVRGWAFAEGQNCDTQKIYLELYKAEGDDPITYTTDVQTRTDVGDYFSDARYNESGFVAKIPEEELPDGLYTLRVLVEHQKRIWTSEACQLLKVGQNVGIVVG